MVNAAELENLAQGLVQRSSKAQAIMLVPVSAQARSAMVVRRLAAKAAKFTGRPSWIIDLDFERNPQSQSVRLNGQAYSGEPLGETFWQVSPPGSGRLAMRKAQAAPVFISRFEREPGAVRALQYRSSPRYWDLTRQSCGLVLVDAPLQARAMLAVAGDLDGVILVADSVSSSRSQADALAERIEDAGGHVLGVVLTEPRQAP